jgi:hypothetical protein
MTGNELGYILVFVLVVGIRILWWRMANPPDITMNLAEKLVWGRFLMECAVSALVLSVALYVAVGHGTTDAQKWAYGAIGLVLGHWLKTDKPEASLKPSHGERQAESEHEKQPQQSQPDPLA